MFGVMPISPLHSIPAVFPGPGTPVFALDRVETVSDRELDLLGVHDIVVHNYGPSRVMLSLHVEVPSDETLLVIHDSIDEIEKELRQKYHCTAVIHMDPVDSSDSEAMAIKSWLMLNIEEIDPNIEFHDLRLVRKDGEKPLVEFDLEVPYRYKMADDKLVELVTERLRELGSGYDYDITVDKKEK